MRARVLATAALLLLPACRAAGAGREAAPPHFTVVTCVAADGSAEEPWTTGIAVAIGRERAVELAGQCLPLSDEARAWRAVAIEAAPEAARRGRELADHVGVPPFDATVALGNRGSSDGFGWVPSFIGINLQAFAETYGAPDEDAHDRMTRILAHEYLHLLTYARYPDHRDLRTTPLERALWTIFFEGVGDFVSVSQRWRPLADGRPSPVATEALERLEPVLVERLEALAEAAPEDEPALREGMAWGPFDGKWGSLPYALWLHAEAAQRGEAAALKWALELGPRSVAPLARLRASPEVAALLGRLEDSQR